MKPAEHIRANVTNDGLVVLDIDKGQIFSANVIAARIWQGIVVENKPKDEVVDAIVKEYGSTPDIVGRDLDAFMEKVRAQELVVES